MFSAKNVKGSPVKFDAESPTKKLTRTPVRNIEEGTMEKNITKEDEGSPAREFKSSPIKKVQDSPDKIAKKRSKKKLEYSPERDDEESPTKILKGRPGKKVQDSPNKITKKSSKKKLEYSSDKDDEESPTKIFQGSPVRKVQDSPDRKVNESPKKKFKCSPLNSPVKKDTESPTRKVKRSHDVLTVKSKMKSQKTSEEDESVLPLEETREPLDFSIRRSDVFSDICGQRTSEVGESILCSKKTLVYHVSKADTSTFPSKETRVSEDLSMGTSGRFADWCRPRTSHEAKSILPCEETRVSEHILTEASGAVSDRSEPEISNFLKSMLSDEVRVYEDLPKGTCAAFSDWHGPRTSNIFKSMLLPEEVRTFEDFSMGTSRAFTDWGGPRTFDEAKGIFPSEETSAPKYLFTGGSGLEEPKISNIIKSMLLSEDLLMETCTAFSDWRGSRTSTEVGSNLPFEETLIPENLSTGASVTFSDWYGPRTSVFARRFPSKETLVFHDISTVKDESFIDLSAQNKSTLDLSPSSYDETQMSQKLAFLDLHDKPIISVWDQHALTTVSSQNFSVERSTSCPNLNQSNIFLKDKSLRPLEESQVSDSLSAMFSRMSLGSGVRNLSSERGYPQPSKSDLFDAKQVMCLYCKTAYSPIEEYKLDCTKHCGNDTYQTQSFSESFSELKYQCFMCDAKFCDLITIKCHLKCHHSLKGITLCERCKQMFQ